MPWRVGPAARRAGQQPEAYQVWLSEVMLQQTTVAAVRDYFTRFTRRWPGVADLAAAEDADVMAEWAGLGYYARARNLLACARAVVRDYGGRFPESRDALLKLPGIGPYTAAAVAAIAFDEAATVVDGNVERVISRMFRIETPLPGAKPELTALAASLTPQLRPGDYAQAIMDLGATICTPRNPACALCPWRDLCRAHADGVQAELPRKAAKAAKPIRYGRVWLLRRGDLWLIERRPPRGLLGGMLGFPGDGWDGAGHEEPPLAARWHEAGQVSHIFTHFQLELRVMRADLANGSAGGDGQGGAGNPHYGEWHALNPDDLPTLMRKAYEKAISMGGAGATL